MILSIREAGPDDIEALRLIYRDTWRATYEPLFGPSVVEQMVTDLLGDPLLHAMLPGNGETALLAISAGQPAGAVIVRDVHRVAYLWGMYVSPAFQRRGIGSALLSRARLSLPDSRRIEANVLAASSWAIGFYQAHGFREMRREKVQICTGVNPDSIVMEMDLEANGLTGLAGR
jgi:ribosomal protein S18 acetylase RimI-like enzyme